MEVKVKGTVSQIVRAQTPRGSWITIGFVLTEPVGSKADGKSLDWLITVPDHVAGRYGYLIRDGGFIVLEGTWFGCNIQLDMFGLPDPIFILQARKFES